MGEEPEVKAPRVVLDTNVIVSALFFEGPASALVAGWQTDAFDILLCGELLDEYIRVLSYPKFNRTTEQVDRYIREEIVDYAAITRLKKPIPTLIKEDPSDNIVLGCAVSGRAKYIVSGDKHLLTHKAYKGIPILKVKEAISILIG